MLKLVFSEIRLRIGVQVVSCHKNRPIIGRPDRSTNQSPVFLAGNHLNSCPPDSALRKIWLYYLWYQGVDFQKEDLSEQELIIGALLHKLQLGFTFNVHLIYRLTGEMDGNIPLDMVGSALYHFCIILNHSCGANTTRFFQACISIALLKVIWQWQWILTYLLLYTEPDHHLPWWS